MENLEQLIQRRERLQSVEAGLNRNAPLTTVEGMKYMKCLALAMYEMQIRERKSRPLIGALRKQPKPIIYNI